MNLLRYAFQISNAIGNVNRSTPRSYTCRQRRSVRRSCWHAALQDRDAAPQRKEEDDWTHLEALLPVLVLLEEVGKVDDDLRVGDLELKDAVVHGLCRLDGPDRLLEVDVERPQLERLEQAVLRRKVLRAVRRCQLMSVGRSEEVEEEDARRRGTRWSSNSWGWPPRAA